MENTSGITVAMQTVFERVIGMKIVEVRRTIECARPEMEYPVAVLPFEGNCAHYLSMATPHRARF